LNGLRTIAGSAALPERSGRTGLKKLSQRQLAIYLSVMTITMAVLLCAFFGASIFIDFRYRGGLDFIQRQFGYNAVTLSLNYIQFGAVRRGLIGTIIYLSGFDLIYAAFALYVVSCLALIVLSFFILRRMIVPCKRVSTVSYRSCGIATVLVHKLRQ